MHRFVRAICVTTALSVLASLVGPTAPAGGANSVSYIPPIDAPVVDSFRPPASQFTAGNRGLDYAAMEGDAVRASADGRVVFSGRIGSDFHVTVLHDDGIRTSYSFLRDTAVRRGDRVAQGQIVGTAAGAVHFGARAGSAYLDPADLFAGEMPNVRLVPLEDLPSAVEERSWLQRRILALGRGVIAGARWTGEQVAAAGEAMVDVTEERLRTALHYLRTLAPPLATADLMLEVVDALADWEFHRETCTPRGVEPPQPDGRRIAVLVGGLGSSSAALKQGRGIGGVNAAALGFAPSDTYYFSYQGGHLGERGYGPEDTQNGFEESGAKLSALMSRIKRANPGVPIVLIAHSQGGLVARAALAHGAAGAESVADLVTLATPHRGSDAATGISSLRGTVAQPVVDAVGESFAGLDPGSRSVKQLSETSDFIRNLPAVPPEVRFTSIAAEGDLIVATPRARVEGADNRIVSPGSTLHDHDAVTSHPETQREIKLALAGRAETCKSRSRFVGERVRGHLTSLGVDALSAVTTVGLSRIPPPVRR